MGLGEGGLGLQGYGQDFFVPMQGCNPLLRDTQNQFWALGIDDNGELTLDLSSTPINHHEGPLLGTRPNVWKLSIDANQDIQVDKVTPSTILGTLPYIPLRSPIGGAWALTVDENGNLQVDPTDYLYPDIIPYQPDVSMSLYGDMPPMLICTTCGNASVTASADLSLWCCTCSSFVLPEDTNIIVVLDE